MTRGVKEFLQKNKFSSKKSFFPLSLSLLGMRTVLVAADDAWRQGISTMSPEEEV